MRPCWRTLANMLSHSLKPWRHRQSWALDMLMSKPNPCNPDSSRLLVRLPAPHQNSKKSGRRPVGFSLLAKVLSVTHASFWARSGMLWRPGYSESSKCGQPLEACENQLLSCSRNCWNMLTKCSLTAGHLAMVKCQGYFWIEQVDYWIIKININ